MAALILNHSDGTTETRELSRSQPLTIGRQPFNDICVPESEVASFHCRISWNKTCFEVTAATPVGVEVNATTVAHQNLKPEDLIRVGSLDLIFQDESFVTNMQRPQLVVPPTSKSTPIPSTARVPATVASSPRKSKAKPEPVEKPVVEKPVEDMSLFMGMVQTESQAMMDSLFADDDSDDLGEQDHFLGRLPETKPPTEIGGVPKRHARPGEQEVLKSPLVLGLTFGGMVLLLVTGILWFFMSREQSNRLYERAVAEMNDGQYSLSVSSFEKFISQYPSHAMRKQADRNLAKTVVLKEISGAAPAWKHGLERLNELIADHRKDSDFSEMHSSLFQYAEQISLGAAKAAETARDPEFLVISKEAQTLLERYADPTTPPTGTIGRINEQRLKADRAIEKQKAFDLAMKAVDAAIADRKPMIALSERERLVRSFPDFMNTKRVKEALQKALDLERSVIIVDENEQPAQTVDDPPRTIEPILGLLQARSRTDEASQGRVVFAIAKDSCYAVDNVTGDLVWRRVIGADSPFFPVVTTGAQASVLMFDTNKQALLACQLVTGKLIWRQPLNARAIGGPLVHEGQIYLATEGNSLVRMDVDTGRISAKAKFSQNLATTPALARDGDYLLVPGQIAMIYSLALKATSTRQPLAAVATTFTDHAAGSISAPPLSMGRLLLLCENDQAESAKLRLWDASNPSQSLIELDSTRTTGQVRDVPVLRGNQLVVPSSGEQFDAFVVTDEAGRAGIAKIGQYRANFSANAIEAPLYVALGSDGQFWSAGSAFRKFEISSNNIRMDSNTTAPGIASQPLQLAGEQFFVGRKSRYSDAVTFSAVERDKLVIPWRCILGDEPLEMVATRDGGFTWVGESGSLYAVGKNRIAQGGVEIRAGTDLDLPQNVAKPIRATALHDQRLIVAAAGETAQLFVFNTTGQLTSKHPLEELPEADPVLLDNGLVLPLPARLKILSLSSGKKPAQDWLAPVGENLEHHWTHLVRLDGRELIACNRSGRLTRIQFRDEDVPHLAEVAKLQLEQSIDVRPVLRGDYLYVADASGTIRQLNIHSFDAESQRLLAPPIKNLWSIGSNTLVHAGDHKVHCLPDEKGLPDKWTFELKNLEPIGPIVAKDDAIWISCRNGTILILNPETGAELRRIELPQSLSLGLRQSNETLFAVACDGTLYRLE